MSAPLWFGIGVLLIIAGGLGVSYLLSPPCGERRVYDSATLPVLYPGELAAVQFPPVSPEMLRRALAEGQESIEVRPRGYLVEPAPGWRMAWRRLQFRCIGWWLQPVYERFNVRPRIRGVVHKREE